MAQQHAAAPPATRQDGLDTLPAAGTRRLELALQLQQAILDNMAEGMVLCSADSGHILRTNPRYDAMLGYAPGELVGRHGSVVNSPAEADPLAVAQAIVLELRRNGEWCGVLRNRRKDGRDIWCRVAISTFEHDELGRVWVNLCSDVTDAREAELARDRADGELRRLAARTQELLEAERAALSRDLHDQLGAALTGMRMRLEALAAQLPPAAAAELGAITHMAQAASVQTRAICARLRPPALDDLGLVEALRVTLDEWAAASGVKVRRHLPRLPEEPPPGVAIDLFRMLQELLTNVARHARARGVTVSLAARSGAWVLGVADDGVGFDPAAGTEGFGLLGLRERAQRHGGAVQVRSGAGGTSVTVRLPRGARA
jgi:PAS domain S-box-containing protein